MRFVRFLRLGRAVPMALAMLLAPAMLAAARADCPDQPIICRAPLYKPLEYSGCAIAGNLDPGGMCWSWWPMGCFPCDGDAGQCNALNLSECQGACQALTGLMYYDACNLIPGPPGLAQSVPAPKATAQAVPSTAPESTPKGVGKAQKWVGTLTPKGAEPLPVTLHAWRYDQPHLQIEINGQQLWATDITWRPKRIAFAFLDNDEARCELEPNGNGAFVGTCVQPKAGKARLRIRLAAD